MEHTSTGSHVLSEIYIINVIDIFPLFWNASGTIGFTFVVDVGMRPYSDRWQLYPIVGVASIEKIKLSPLDDLSDFTRQRERDIWSFRSSIPEGN